MIFSKSFDEIKYEDVEKLIDSNITESLILDYKKEIIGDDRSKKEILKDISSMANSSGGYIIIGIDEDKESGYPVKPFYGTSRIINNQKVEEWLEQVIRSNIQPNINFRIKPIPFLNEDEKCLIIIYVPMSLRSPHMVTYNGDNRYYIRHNTQSTPAENYEIIELFERSKRMEDKIKKFFGEKNYLDKNSDNFCQNDLTKNLIDDYISKPAESVVVFISIPEFFEEKIDFLSDYIEKFLLNEYFIPPSKRATLEGRLFFKTYPSSETRDKYIRYLHLYKNGITEYGLSDIYKILQGNEMQNKWFYNKKFFSFAKIIGYFWEFLKFLNNYYNLIKYTYNLKIIINFSNTENTYLSFYGKGWLQPFDPEYTLYDKEKCLSKNLQIIEDINIFELNNEKMKSLVYRIAEQIGNAYGQDIPRCFNKNTIELPENWYY